MLKLERVSVAYNGAASAVPVLQHIQLTLGASEALALQGRYGAGCSTLLKAIAGYAGVTSGQILLGDELINAWPVFKRANVGIAYLPEDKALFYELTAQQNLLIGAGLQSKRKTQKMLEEMYARFPMLANCAQVMAGALSGGEQQLLALARTLMRPAKVLLLDEPTQGLAPHAIEQVVSYLNHVKTSGARILLVDRKQQVSRALAAGEWVLS